MGYVLINDTLNDTVISPHHKPSNGRIISKQLIENGLERSSHDVIWNIWMEWRSKSQYFSAML